MKFNFNNSYRDNVSIVTNIDPDPVSKPKLIIYNSDLGEELGIGEAEPENYLSGNLIPEGGEPIAMAYSGHQFGYYNVLGDGRAILLGEHLTDDGKRFDIQLKGSGRTPYSRGGDGRATLSSMLREYIISFAVEKLGVPTTRSLAVVDSGDPVYREEIHRGGVLTRVAESHIRVGTFEFIAMKRDWKLLQEFTDYTINRLYPHLSESSTKYLDFYKEVFNKQIDLIINWMRIGFIHGVMNTDNMSISGETIDYGPCAFMDDYNPKTVFSSIDHHGRYSFSNQEYIGKWNLARLGECLIPLVDSSSEVALEKINDVISSYDSTFRDRWALMMSKKLGFSEPVNKDFIDELLKLMEDNSLDYTRTFRDIYRNNPLPDSALFTDWYRRWKKLNPDEAIMNSVNPNIIPRNHIVEDALREATKRYNKAPLEDLLNALRNPYGEYDNSWYRNPPGERNPNYRTFCGT